MKIISSIISLAVATLGHCHVNAQIFTNADFETGNFGFASDYQFAGSNTDEGQFTVRSDPQNWNGEFINFGDHTTGTGKMLVVNGATSGGPAVWRQTIAVQTNTAYGFRVWTGTAVAGGPANLLLKVDGNQIGSSFVLPDEPGVWVLWEQPWTSSSDATATFEIINANTSRFPNDFYLDDIGLHRTSIELFIKRNGDEFELSWPTDPMWGLFTSSSMLPGSWNPATNSPSTSGMESILRLPLDASRAFFRLQPIP